MPVYTGAETGVMVQFPFSVRGGSIALSSNPSEIMQSMIVFCLGSQIGERVMRPEWGIDVENSFFAMGADFDGAIKEAVDEVFRMWFPGHVVREVTVTHSPSNPSKADVSVSYGAEDSAVDQMARVGVMLPSGSEILADERGF